MASNGLFEVKTNTIDSSALYTLEIVFTMAAPAFDILFIGCVLNTKIVYTTAEKLTFETFY